MAKVYDCFPFFNELDVLEIRLNELDPVVDHFVLCEATVTHRGQPKPLVFQENRERFARFLPKIIHVVVDDMPQGKFREADFWVKEKFQRMALMRGLTSARDEDFVILSDLDEIPSAKAVAAGIARNDRSVTVFDLVYCCFFVNLINTRIWQRARMARFGDIRSLQMLRSGGPQWHPEPNQRGLWRRIRHLRRTMLATRLPRSWVIIEDAGWHFTSLNGLAAVYEKFNSYAHVRDDVSELGLARRILRLLEGKGEDGAHLVPFDERFPDYLRANRERFKHLIADENTVVEFRQTIERLEKQQAAASLNPYAKQ
jgi:beta-1,4-mannosyl-glycoprotein beta-1,4-N-acetylglucosaminyltransferase